MPELAPSTPPTEPAARRSQRYLAVFAVSTLAAMLFLVWISSDAAKRDALVHLPPSERQALYERTLHTLESTCDAAKRPSGLENFCREQAEFIVQFPECDAACSALSRTQRGIPTR